MKEATHQRVVTGWYLYGFHRTAREVSADGNCAHWIKSSSEMEAFIGWVALQRLILEDNACLLFDRKVAKVKDPYIRMCWLTRRLLKAGWLLPIVGFHCHFRPYISTLNWWRSLPFFFSFFFFFPNSTSICLTAAAFTGVSHFIESVELLIRTVLTHSFLFV